MDRPYARIAGWGHYLPQRVLTNTELEGLVNTSAEWIRSRTGIEERRIADPEEATGSMATIASERALARAGVDPAAVDMVILATNTPDNLGIGTASLVQHHLGAKSAAAFDLSAGCSGWLYGLVTAAQFVQTGLCRNVIVVGSETLSRFVDWQDRGTCVLFGDGAGAALVQPSEEPGGMLSAVLGSDGSGYGNPMIPGGGARLPASRHTLEQRLHYIHMGGTAVYRWAVEMLPTVILEATARAGLTPADIDLIIPHQANIRIVDAVRKRLGDPAEKMVMNIQRYGNTSAASIPIALSEAADQGRLQRGHNISFGAFGAGLTWAVVVWKWNL